MKINHISKEILPTELFDLFETVEYENYGSFLNDKVEFKSNSIEFYFTIKLDEGFVSDNKEYFHWKLVIKNCKDYQISDSKNIEAFITVFSEHFLLSQYQKSWKELYFKEEGANLNQLFVDFYNLHYFDFEYFIIPEKYLATDNLSFLINSKSGLFARGPEDILNLYHNLLLKYGKNPYYFENTAQVKNISNDNLKIVFLGNNYFIAEELEFIKL
ncbi:hypothetical protein [Chryseobacterium sp.]|uniref:hypothetical protein n=1 Tax=Chryseobacterium sp. TaxID=1871047 RepID=UPI002897E068|nr:hypothetical protein [Chryseobacterium sp.]